MVGAGSILGGPHCLPVKKMHQIQQKYSENTLTHVLIKSVNPLSWHRVLCRYKLSLGISWCILLVNHPRLYSTRPVTNSFRISLVQRYFKQLTNYTSPRNSVGFIDMVGIQVSGWLFLASMKSLNVANFAS